MKATVLSSGSWGTALAKVLCDNGHDVTMWGRDDAYIQEMNESRINSRYLEEFTLPKTLKLTSDFVEAVKDSEMIVISTPTQYYC